MLSIVVPARDEEANIERCVRSLLGQTLRNVEVIAVDDRSSDATLAILRRLSAEDPRLRVVAGKPLPEGWVGKPWALEQGVAAASGAWLLFTDADSYHEPDAESSTLQFALERNVDAVSLATRQELGSFWERAVLPSILSVIVVGFANRPLANGQYILVSRAAYEGLGGHCAVRGEIAEDVAFAKLMHDDGRFRLRLANGTHLVKVRMYRSLPEIWEGFTKNVFIGANGSAGRAALAVASLAMLSVVPPALALTELLRGRKRAALEALCCTVTTMVAAGRTFSVFGAPRSYGVFQPVGFALLGAIVVNATYCVVSGRGVAWRGRRYPGR